MTGDLTGGGISWWDVVCDGIGGGGAGHPGFANCGYGPLTVAGWMDVSTEGWLNREFSSDGPGGLGLPRIAVSIEYSRLAPSDPKGYDGSRDRLKRGSGSDALIGSSCSCFVNEDV